MSEYADFKPFYEAMSKEMLRHAPEKGDTWKDPSIYVEGNWGRIPVSTRAYLESLLRKRVADYSMSLDADELVDIANIVAMLWLRGER